MDKPKKIGVVITTYNSPLWLSRVLQGYDAQLDRDFTILIADDGSNADTKAVVDTFAENASLRISHYWHEDRGFRKTEILNKVISETDCDYLIFTDGDCIPRSDFVAVHREFSAKGAFLSGGYIKLTMPVSEAISEVEIGDQSLFSKKVLVNMGQPRSLKLTKLTKSPVLVALLNYLTPTKATWNGMNSSGWTADLMRINGFDERMQYGGLDRELGERLWNSGLKSKQIRYRAVCLHLDHPRGYAKPEIWQKNHHIRKQVVTEGRTWSEFGIHKGPKDEAIP